MNKTSALHLSLLRNNVNDNVYSKLKQYKELKKSHHCAGNTNSATYIMMLWTTIPSFCFQTLSRNTLNELMINGSPEGVWGGWRKNNVLHN